MFSKYCLSLILLLLNEAICSDLSRVCFVLMSQPHKKHQQIAEETRPQCCKTFFIPN
jgi:hypothetical protein